MVPNGVSSRPAAGIDDAVRVGVAHRAVAERGELLAARDGRGRINRSIGPRDRRDRAPWQHGSADADAAAQSAAMLANMPRLAANGFAICRTGGLMSAAVPAALRGRVARRAIPSECVPA